MSLNKLQKIIRPESHSVDFLTLFGGILESISPVSSKSKHYCFLLSNVRFSSSLPEGCGMLCRHSSYTTFCPQSCWALSSFFTCSWDLLTLKGVIRIRITILCRNLLKKAYFRYCGCTSNIKCQIQEFSRWGCPHFSLSCTVKVLLLKQVAVSKWND